MIQPTENDLGEFLQTWQECPRTKLFSIQLSEREDADNGFQYIEHVSFYGQHIATYYRNNSSAEYLYATMRGFVVLHESHGGFVYKFERLPLWKLIQDHPELLHNLYAPSYEERVGIAFDPNYYLHTGTLTNSRQEDLETLTRP